MARHRGQVARTRWAVVDPARFSAGVRAVCAAAGGESALARRTGIPQQRISEWLYGKRRELARETVHRLDAAALWVSVRPGRAAEAIVRDIDRLRRGLYAGLRAPAVEPDGPRRWRALPEFRLPEPPGRWPETEDDRLLWGRLQRGEWRALPEGAMRVIDLRFVPALRGRSGLITLPAHGGAAIVVPLEGDRCAVVRLPRECRVGPIPWAGLR